MKRAPALVVALAAFALFIVVSAERIADKVYGVNTHKPYYYDPGQPPGQRWRSHHVRTPFPSGLTVEIPAKDRE